MDPVEYEQCADYINCEYVNVEYWGLATHAVGWNIMMLISKIEMSVINKMANVFVDKFITGEPW